MWFKKFYWLRQFYKSSIPTEKKILFLKKKRYFLYELANPLRAQRKRMFTYNWMHKKWLFIWKENISTPQNISFILNKNAMHLMYKSMLILMTSIVLEFYKFFSTKSSMVLCTHANLFGFFLKNFFAKKYMLIYYIPKFLHWTYLKHFYWKSIKIKKVSNLFLFNFSKMNKSKNLWTNKYRIIQYFIIFKKLNPSLKKFPNISKDVAFGSKKLKLIKLQWQSHTNLKKNHFFKKTNLFKLLKHKTFKQCKFIFMRSKWFRIYYNNRKLLKYFYNFRTKKQYFLTKTLIKWIKKSQQSILLSNEFSIVTLLLHSKFCLSYQHARDLIFLGQVYINARQISKINYVAKLSDVIQIIFSKKYFIFHKLLFITFLWKFSKIKYYFNRWYKHRYNFYKQHPKQFPNWLAKLMFFKLDVPLFLEVDYSTLSIIIIRYPYYFYELNLYWYKYINLYLTRLYNWKYVT